MTWRVLNDSLLIGRYGAAPCTQSAKVIKGKQKIAAFDFVRQCTIYFVSARRRIALLMLHVVGLYLDHVCFWETIRSRCGGLEVVARQRSGGGTKSL